MREIQQRLKTSVRYEMVVLDIVWCCIAWNDVSSLHRRAALARREAQTAAETFCWLLGFVSIRGKHGSLARCYLIVFTVSNF